MDRNQIKKHVSRCINEANKKFGVTLPPLVIDFTDKGTSAGTAYPTKNRLVFNETLARENPDNFEFVIYHEISHLVTYQKYGRYVRPHGKEFKQIATILGGEKAASTYHSFDVSSVAQRKTKTRYEGKCACKTHHMTKKYYEFAQKGKCFCVGCKEQIVLTGFLVKIK